MSSPEETILYGIDAAEGVALAIFLWGAYVFFSIRGEVVKKALSADDYYIFWISGLLFLCLHQLLRVLDGVPGLDLLDAVRPLAFLAGSSLFSFGLFKSYRKYKAPTEALK